MFEAASEGGRCVWDWRNRYRMKIFGLMGKMKGSKDSQYLICIKIYLDII